MSNHIEQRNPGGTLSSLLGIALYFLALSATPTHADVVTAAATTLDRVTRSKVIEATVSTLNKSYVYPEVANQMERTLREHQARGDYDEISDPNLLAATLTIDLQSVSHDKHLEVHFTSLPQNKLIQEASVDPRKSLEAGNCGFEEAKHLPGNIGYIKSIYFGDPAICESTAAAALNFIANADAVIFDLRDNGGGSASMVDFITTYFFEQPKQLGSLYFRESDFTQERWTRKEVPGKRLIDQPVYSLISSKTFSAAESFAYDLQSFKRAIIIGEISGGGAHPLRTESVYGNFTLNVPFIRVINPITKTDWEGVGVVPDIPIPADQALTTAEDLAKKEKLKSEK